jgi:hypothetical protein
MSLNEQQCTLLLSYDGQLALSKESDFMQQLEQKDENIKVGGGDRRREERAATSRE